VIEVTRSGSLAKKIQACAHLSRISSWVSKTVIARLGARRSALTADSGIHPSVFAP
jgi:hypothetical protein